MNSGVYYEAGLEIRDFINRVCEELNITSMQAVAAIKDLWEHRERPFLASKYRDTARSTPSGPERKGEATEGQGELLGTLDKTGEPIYKCHGNNGEALSLRSDLSTPTGTGGIQERKGNATELASSERRGVMDREFDTGAKKSAHNKGRFDLLPAESIERFAFRMQDALVHYEEENWRKGMPIQCFIDSASRHINDWRMGRDNEDHLAAAGCCLMMAMSLEQYYPDGLPEYRQECNPWYGINNYRRHVAHGGIE